MVNFKGPKVKVEVRKGEVRYEDNNRTLRLMHGRYLIRDSAKVLIWNTDPEGRYLTIDKYRSRLGKLAGVGRIKINPGKARTIEAPYAAIFATIEDDFVLKNGVFHEVDPDPAEKGGKTPFEVTASDLWDGFKAKAPWIIGGTAALGVTIVAVKHRDQIKEQAAKIIKK